MLRCAEDQVLSVGDETYSVVSCLCVISRVLTRDRCDLPLANRFGLGNSSNEMENGKYTFCNSYVQWNRSTEHYSRKRDSLYPG